MAALEVGFLKRVHRHAGARSPEQRWERFLVMSENAMFGQCAQCGSTLTNGHQCAPRKVFVRPGSNQALYDEAFELLKRACELLLAARDKHESATAQETPVAQCEHDWKHTPSQSECKKCGQIIR
jgi:hypothetical protein